jgi:hypothetical protein
MFVYVIHLSEMLFLCLAQEKLVKFCGRNFCSCVVNRDISVQYLGLVYHSCSDESSVRVWVINYCKRFTMLLCYCGHVKLIV